MKNFKSLYGFGGRCLKIRDVCIACVASVSVQFGSKELQGDEWSKRGGRGKGRKEGRKETLADKPSSRLNSHSAIKVNAFCKQASKRKYLPLL